MVCLVKGVVTVMGVDAFVNGSGMREARLDRGWFMVSVLGRNRQFSGLHVARNLFCPPVSLSIEIPGWPLTTRLSLSPSPASVWR